MPAQQEKNQRVVKRRGRGGNRQWHLMDLHLHTPASSDYQEPDISYLEVLRRSKARGLEIIAFTDHNTVAGYRDMQEEIRQLKILEQLERLTPDEKERLKDYRNLLDEILVLPGFEFTATFGFHILGIFPPDKSVREIEHLLLNLNIPGDQLDKGSSTVGATSDVLQAYHAIANTGGLAIAAHANSTNGVAMRGFAFGGQTKIAFTQDPNLAALEVTDLDTKGRRSTAAFFSGIKPEYPRRMHCIQGSDAHRLRTDPNNKKNLGIGDRATEVLLEEVSFEGLANLFSGNDFARTRPNWASADGAYDFIQQAVEEGPSINQGFHDSITVRGGKLYAVIADVCAFANTNGGTLYIGISPDPKIKTVGVSNPQSAVRQLQKEIAKRITPQLQVEVDTQVTNGKAILRALVPGGDDPPYAVDDNKVYVRDESETGLAVRDEIVQLVRRAVPQTVRPAEPEPVQETSEPHAPQPPRTGVEIVEVEERNGEPYYTMRDLRNGNVVKNVTEGSARRLWHYAITQYRSLPQNIEQASISWQGDLGVLAERSRGKGKRFDLVQRTPEKVRLYFGVTEDGVHGEWRRLLGYESD
jgi:hypothetical protein